MWARSRALMSPRGTGESRSIDSEIHLPIDPTALIFLGSRTARLVADGQAVARSARFSS